MMKTDFSKRELLMNIRLSQYLGSQSTKARLSYRDQGHYLIFGYAAFSYHFYKGNQNSWTTGALTEGKCRSSSTGLG
jgi:hypothetical protein